MSNWLNYDLLNTSISVAELFLALLSAGVGGTVVGKSSAILRLRVEKRAELLAAFESRAISPAFANGSVLAELLPEASAKWLENPQQLGEHAQDSFKIWADHIRSVGDADQLVELLPFFDRTCWYRYRHSLEPFETSLGEYMMEARRARESTDDHDRQALRNFIRTHDQLRMKILAFNAAVSTPFGDALGLADARNAADPLYRPLTEGRHSITEVAAAAVALRTYLRRRLRPSVINGWRARLEQLDLLRWWISWRRSEAGREFRSRYEP